MALNIDAASAAILEPLRDSVSFSLAVPGSKSLANRALLLAGVAVGESRLSQVPDSDDIRAALSALNGLGLFPSSPESGTWRVPGHGLDFPERDGDIDIRSSGTVGRFLPGLLSAALKGNWRLVSSDQLARRPLTPLLDALGAWGARIEQLSPNHSFPLRVTGSGLQGGETTVSAAKSSQFASGLLLAAPLCWHRSVVHITDLDPEECYIDLTLDLMRRFGVETESSKTPGGQTVAVQPQPYRAADLTIEADFNSALYFLALPLLVGGKVGITNLSAASGQPGRKFLDVLKRLGGDIRQENGMLTASGDGSTLRGGFAIDMRAMSEMALTLGVLAVFADQPITMTNLAHIRGHETDRLAVLAELLGQIGARCEEGSDWIKIHPVPRSELKNVVIDSHDDHRFVMSFALLGLAGNGLAIRNPGAVAKTFPDFFDRLSASGCQVAFE